jgi:DNA invertase Pin-like site-specific DNA recombinase
MPAKKQHKRVAIYVRVSTDQQTTENQLQELRNWAERGGHQVVKEYADNGISGSRGRDKRSALDQMLKDTVRRKFDLVAVWSVDRLGRNLQGLLDTLQELHAAGVDLYLHHQALDTSTPSGRALFQMMRVFAEFERAMIQERVKAGVARAKAQGTTFGRPTIGHEKEKRILQLYRQGKSYRAIARDVECGIVRFSECSLVVPAHKKRCSQ